MDTRLDYYRNNQNQIPQICGQVVPEQAFNEADYQRMVYDPITAAIQPYDTEQILDAVWLNSREAIARFDRGSVEIRILDIQESPQADLALLNLIIHVLKLMVDEKMCSLEEQQQWQAAPLAELLLQVAKSAGSTVIENLAYLALLRWDHTSVTAQDLWKYLFQKALTTYPEALTPWKSTIEALLESGSLSTRILKQLDGVHSRQNLKLVYSELCDCLQDNDTFEICLQPTVSS